MTSKYWDPEKLNYVPRESADFQHSDMELVVVDDFLDDPYAVRAQLLGLAYEPPPDPKNGVISFNAQVPDNLLNDMKFKIEQVLNKSINYHPRTKCAMTYKHIPHNCICHVDGGDGMKMFNWTVVVYLNLPEQCQGGTLFYQHIPTGDIYNKRGTLFYQNDFADASKWKLIEQVEMQFNRAMFCPAWRFHSLSNTFGTDKETARLTLNPKVIAI